MRVRWTPHARDQLRAIRSDRLRARLRSWMRILQRFREAGRMVPEFELPDHREVIVGVFRVGYQLVENEILIVTIQDGRQEFHWPDRVSEAIAPYELTSIRDGIVRPAFSYDFAVTGT